jgi:hypothetical protein
LLEAQRDRLLGAHPAHLRERSRPATGRTRAPRVLVVPAFDAVRDCGVAGRSNKPSETCCSLLLVPPQERKPLLLVPGAEPKAASKSAHVTAQPTASTPQAGTTVQVSEKEFKIMLASTTLKAGQITFDVKNVGAVPHDLVIAGTSDRTKLISPGQTATLTAQLKLRAGTSSTARSPATSRRGWTRK